MAQDISDVGMERPEPLLRFSVVVVWVLLAELYGVFAGSVGTTEVIAGAVCAGLGTLWARRTCSRGGMAIPLRAGMLRPLAGAVMSLPSQTLRVGFDLLRAVVDGSVSGAIRIRSMSSVSRFDLTDDSGEAKAERALGVFAASLAPRSYVLRLDPKGSKVVLHILETR